MVSIRRSWFVGMLVGSRGSKKVNTRRSPWWLAVGLIFGLIASQEAMSQQVCKLYRWDKTFNGYGWTWTGYVYNSPAEAGAAALAYCQSQPIINGPCAVGGGGWTSLTFTFVSASETAIVLYIQGSYPYDSNYTAYHTAEVESKNCPVPEVDPKKNACEGKPGSCSTVGNPINISLMAKVQLEEDYRSAGPTPLKFERRYYSNGYYDANYLPDRTLGERWRHDYDRAIVSPIGDFNNRAIAIRGDGRMLYFYLTSGVWAPENDIEDALVRTTDGSGAHTGWIYTTTESAVETYDVSGRLISIAGRTGVTQFLTYSTLSTPISIAPKPGLLVSVADSFGRELHFTYDSLSRLTALTDPAGGLFMYAYDSNGMLESVTYPDTTSHAYAYGESAYMQGVPRTTHLTGIIDESGNRFATYSYDGDGHAIGTEHAGGANATSVAYTLNSNGSVTSAAITDALGTVRNRAFLFRQGVSIGYSQTEGGVSNSSTWDANGNRTSATDFKGNKDCYKYNTTRNLETARVEGVISGTSCPSDPATYTPVAGSAQRKILTTWHSSFRLPTLITEQGRKTDFTYDSSGNQLTRTITDTATSQTRTWTYTYSSLGQVLSEDGPRTDVSDITTYSYYNCATGNECGQLHSVTNPLGQVITYDFYNAHGLPTQITDENGIVTTLTYDSRMRLVSRAAGGDSLGVEYWPIGLVKKVTLTDGSYLLNTYDTAHRLVKVEDAQGNRIQYVLDGLGNRVSESVYDPSNALARSHSRVIDGLNRIWKEVGAAGTSAVTTVFGYDANGNQTTINAPLSRNTTNAYTARNGLKQITAPGGGITSLVYDAFDNLKSVTDPRGKVTTYQYNGFGDQTQLVSPDTGTAVSTYDSGGNLATHTDARNKTGIYAHDVLNRPTSITYPDQTLSFTYDAGTNGAGRLTGASDSSHSLSWTYDAQGRVTQKIQTAGSVSTTQSYAYTNGNLTSLVTPSGQTIAYGYTAGRVTSITLNGSTAILDQVLYEPFGGVRQWNWGNGTASTTRSHDQDGNITAVDSAGTYTYSHDAAFRITGIADAVDSTKNWTYGYDLLDRLNSATRTGQSIGYTYDANGNRLSQTGTATATYSIASTSNRVTSITGTPARTYTYDAAGNVSGYGGIAFTYSDSGRLSSVSDGIVTTSYIYNALGQRVKKSDGTSTTYFVYDEVGHLVGEYDGAGDLIQEIVWLGDIPVASIRDDGVGGIGVFYIHTDHMDTPRKLTRPNDNAIVWRWDSDPFGVGTPDLDPDGNSQYVIFNLRFPGQYSDAETGLNQNWYRDYDALVGRYSQSDPIGLKGGIGTYTYVGDNPLSSFDVLGLAPTPELKSPMTYDPTKLNTVCCIGGVMKICLNSPNNAKWKCSIVEDSFRVHENSHFAEFQRLSPKICVGTNRKYAIGYASPSDNKASELAAFNAQLDYLNRRRNGGCLSPECEQEVPYAIDRIINWAIPRVVNGTYGQ